MNKIIKYFLIVSVVVSTAMACTSQDDIYQKYVKKGGYDYPAMAINLSSERGFQNVTVIWEKPMDPAVKRAMLFWDNYADSVAVDYNAYADGKVAIKVGNLEDRSYTFDIVNYDEVGNRSLPAEITISPYGDGWLVSRSERSVTSARMEGNDAVVKMTKATDEMYYTKFRYRNRGGEWVECEKVLKPGENEVVFRDAMRGKRFQYSSAFCPAAGRDTVWRSWMTSADGISYQLDGKRWSVQATSGQVFSENTPEKIFDGKNLSGCRWHSSKSEATKLVFPKILAIDTQVSAGNEFAFTEFRFFESPESPSLRYIKSFTMYIGNNSYNPNDARYAENFGIPFLSSVFNTSSAEQVVSVSRGATGRYLSIVFIDSWNAADGYIDLWELVPYGYVPSQAD